ncbi:MAG: MarR family winged helix-turn-helix transcriptional regulator [Gammaproteobacteria bacterium]
MTASPHPVKAALRTRAVDAGVPGIAAQLPALPVPETGAVWLLKALGISLSEFFGLLMGPHGIGESSFYTLMLIHARGGEPITPGVLCGLVGHTPASMTRIIDSLVRSGLVERVADRADRRRVMIRLSKAGQRFMRETLPRLLPALQRVFAGWKAAELAQFQMLMHKLAAGLDRASEEIAAARTRRPRGRDRSWT